MKKIKKKIKVKKLKPKIKVKRSKSLPEKKIKKPKIRKKVRFEFTKMVASGNDFIVFDNRRFNLKNGSEIAAQLCARTEAIGADGLIFIEKSKRADFKMRIFNPDGSEAEMCGNGLRCAALFKGKKKATVETLAGFLESELKDNGQIRVKMTEPKNLQLNVNLDIDGNIYQVNSINPGVPHAIYFVEDLEAINVKLLGRLIRYHRNFQPEGRNVDFVKIIDSENLKIRTYERGVEAETLACGTGSVAAVLIYHHKFVGTSGSYLVNVTTKSEEILKVYFDYQNNQFENVWLEGRARIVYKGECYV